MHDDYLRELIERYQQGRCTPEEQRQLLEWYRALGQERRLDLTPAELAALEQRLWQRLAAQTIEASAPPAAPAWTVWRAAPVRWASAAAVALSLGFGAWHYWSATPAGAPAVATAPAAAPSAASPSPADLVRQINSGAAPVRIALADGSVVMLAPASTLTYPRRFGAGRREVTLVGEGFFEVHHDDNPAHQFKVYTDKVVTTVLGTSFTVRAYPGQPQGVVTVKTGRVRVSPRSGADAARRPADVVVTANQQATYSPAQQELRRTLVAQPALLRPQPFRFANRPVPEVLQALEKGYGVPIDYDSAALARCTVTLSLPPETSLARKLNVLCEALGATYDEADGRIRVHSAGCTAR